MKSRGFAKDSDPLGRVFSNPLVHTEIHSSTKSNNIIAKF